MEIIFQDSFVYWGQPQGWLHPQIHPDETRCPAQGPSPTSTTLCRGHGKGLVIWEELAVMLRDRKESLGEAGEHWWGKDSSWWFCSPLMPLPMYNHQESSGGLVRGCSCGLVEERGTWRRSPKAKKVGRDAPALQNGNYGRLRLKKMALRPFLFPLCAFTSLRNNSRVLQVHQGHPTPTSYYTTHIKGVRN